MNKNIIKDWTISVLVALLLFIVIVGFFHPGKISGESMSATYSDGERVYVLRKFYDINRGDVITFWYPKDEADPSPESFLGKVLRDFNEVLYREPNLSNQELHIKRVVGIPGDHVVVKNEENTTAPDGFITSVYVNDELVAQSEIELSDPGEDCSKGEECDITLDADEYFVIGDNYDNSYDSRRHGPVKEEDVFGKIINSKPNTNEIKQSV